MAELQAKKPCIYQKSNTAILMNKPSSKNYYVYCNVCCIGVKGKIKPVIQNFLGRLRFFDKIIQIFFSLRGVICIDHLEFSQRAFKLLAKIPSQCSSIAN